jgi:hypothetical protein
MVATSAHPRSIAGAGGAGRGGRRGSGLRRDAEAGSGGAASPHSGLLHDDLAAMEARLHGEAEQRPDQQAAIQQVGVAAVAGCCVYLRLRVERM